MSDPAKYRTKEEVEGYKAQDPIQRVLATIVKQKFATDTDLENINTRVIAQVEECVKFAEESPFPDASELFKDIYEQEDYPFIKE